MQIDLGNYLLVLEEVRDLSVLCPHKMVYHRTPIVYQGRSYSTRDGLPPDRQDSGSGLQPQRWTCQGGYPGLGGCVGGVTAPTTTDTAPLH